MTVPTATGIPANALPKASARNIGQIAWLLSIAFAWDRDAELFTRRAGTAPPDQRFSVPLAGAAVPGNVLTGLIYIASGELYHRPGAVLRLQSQSARGKRRRIVTMLGLCAAAIVLVVAVRSPRLSCCRHPCCPFCSLW